MDVITQTGSTRPAVLLQTLVQSAFDCNMHHTGCPTTNLFLLEMRRGWMEIIQKNLYHDATQRQWGGGGNSGKIQRYF